MIETMSIVGGIETYGYSLPEKRYKSNVPPYGRKVIYLNDNGLEIDREIANNYFNEGDVLTVKEIYVGRNSSEVEFIECPNSKFNTVMFEDVIDLSSFITAKVDTTDYRKGNIKNQIRFKDTIIEADDFGRVLVDGKQIQGINDIQDVLHTLIKTAIGAVGGDK